LSGTAAIASTASDFLVLLDGVNIAMRASCASTFGLRADASPNDSRRGRVVGDLAQPAKNPTRA
jgi:hypothetical protein